MFNFERANIQFYFVNTQLIILQKIVVLCNYKINENASS